MTKEKIAITIGKIVCAIGVIVCISNMVDVETTPPVNEPDTIEIPTVAWTPTPDAHDKTDITRLSRYDRDGDGSLNKQELQVIETDYHHKRLTDSEIACFVKVVGYVPVLNPSPVAIATPTIYDLGNTRKIPSYIPPSNTRPIPDDYYSQSCQLPTNVSMQEYLANSEWIYDYEAGSWDCSQMST